MNDNYEIINNLVTKAKNNDTKALYELLEFYSPLIKASLKRCLIKERNLIPYREDLQSEVVFVLKKIVESYDPELSYFSYFLKTRLDFALLNHGRNVFLKSNENIDSYEDFSDDPFNYISDNIDLKNGIDKLSPELQDVINCYFFEGMNQEESAVRLNISQPTFSRRLNKALESLKKYCDRGF
jgi:RNA polymerase sigma factor (sigma-70 family)